MCARCARRTRESERKYLRPPVASSLPGGPIIIETRYRSTNFIPATRNIILAALKETIETLAEILEKGVFFRDHNAGFYKNVKPE